MHDGVQPLAHVFNRHHVWFGRVIRGRTYVATFFATNDGSYPHFSGLGEGDHPGLEALIVRGEVVRRDLSRLKDGHYLVALTSLEVL